MPRREIMMSLLQRLGISFDFAPDFTSRNDLELMELVYKVRNSYIVGDMAAAKTLFTKLNKRYDEMSTIDKQFCLTFKIINMRHSQEISPKDALAQLEDVMKMSCPGYSLKNIPRVMSFEEIIILNNIAICYGEMNMRDKSIYIYYAILDFHKSRVTNTEESLRTLPMIYYNLSNHLGMSGRFDECIDLCNEGISLMKRTGRCRLLPNLIYNLGWCYAKRGYSQDREKAIHLVKRAHLLNDNFLEKKELKDLIEHFLWDEFNIKLS